MGQEIDNRNNPRPGISSALTAMSKVRKQTILVVAALALLGILLFAMTAAWYTNVAETTGLIFETESWGFEGSVQVRDDASVTLAPGRNGYVNLSITNDGEQINDISVSVDKSEMSPQMQKRIYFYVPHVTQENGETMERVYLSPFNGYTYEIMPKTTLLLAEDVATAAPVRYEWVYDVLGYYVYGTVNDAGLLSEEGADAPIYIRPVVYNYEAATYQDNGELLTVDGTTDVPTFLAELSRTDGYAQPITQIGARGRYYPVIVQEDILNHTATGLWVYLCTQGEINQATQFDTSLGTYAYNLAHAAETNPELLASETGIPEPETGVTDSIRSTATICIGGQNLRTVVREVGTADDLIAAVEGEHADGNSTIQLTSDTNLSRPLTVSAGSQVILDLNGKTLTSTGSEPVIEAAPGSSVTIMGGTIDGQDRVNAVRAVGSQVAFHDVTIKGCLRIEDSASTNENGTTSVICVSNSTIEADGANQVGIMILGNGDTNSQKTALIVQNTTINSTYVGIMGNGSAFNYGTDIQVINSTVRGTWGGIYQPQQSSRLVISDNSVVEGFTGVILKGGSALIQDSTVKGTAAPGAGGLVLNPTTFSGSGYSDTGAGVYVEANYNWDISLSITGQSEISSLANQALLVLGPNADRVHWGFEPSVVLRNSGTF